MVVAIFSITAERALQVAFSIPYAGQSAVLIAPKTASIKGPDDLKGLKVGVTRGRARGRRADADEPCRA